jgi:hypothetical protein
VAIFRRFALATPLLRPESGHFTHEQLNRNATNAHQQAIWKVDILVIGRMVDSKFAP